MKKMLFAVRSRLKRHSSVFRSVGVSFVLALVMHGTALAQPIQVTGTVTSAGGATLRGVTVRLVGSDIAVLTGAGGKYTINAPPNGSLSFTLLGQRPQTVEIGGRRQVDVTMQAMAYLEQVVVTGYSEEQRRADITG